MAARKRAAAFGRTYLPRKGFACPTAAAKKTDPHFKGSAFWRRRWDSNPRGLSPYLISSQGRYDHFDTPPRRVSLYRIRGEDVKARGAQGGNVSEK